MMRPGPDWTDSPTAWWDERMQFRTAFSDAELGWGPGERPEHDANPMTGASRAAAEPWWRGVERAVTVITPALVTAWQTKRIADMNRERMRAGLPPLTPQQATAITPPARVHVEPSPGAQQMLMFGALGVGALVLLRMLKVI